MKFHSAVVEHLESIQKKDLSTLQHTLSSLSDISVIMPTGRLIRGYDDVRSMNQDWFNDPDWSFNFSIIKEEETSELGYAVVQVEYHDIDLNGVPYNKKYYLTLILRKIGPDWFLVHDQNTFTD
ncbi:YybH family protein [Bacillus horti]|uniref:Ketosteroid isomerase-like protein n=1 Tax=Caldalkalibacillus horti TaxID=77523 RepID=A0ABT9W5E8_9BACI|nr:nuclear transport factor 2 family protein [Bacillus horti]MDQ0168468.1 ketosteroid isomerase-like protein [Bacillus horti]